MLQEIPHLRGYAIYHMYAWKQAVSSILGLGLKFNPKKGETEGKG
jgi:hypothetical protein